MWGMLVMKLITTWNTKWKNANYSIPGLEWKERGLCVRVLKGKEKKKKETKKEGKKETTNEKRVMREE